jgi:hypothetical protein
MKTSNSSPHTYGTVRYLCSFNKFCKLFHLFRIRSYDICTDRLLLYSSVDFKMPEKILFFLLNFFFISYPVAGTYRYVITYFLKLKSGAL